MEKYIKYKGTYIIGLFIFSLVFIIFSLFKIFSFFPIENIKIKNDFIDIAPQEIRQIIDNKIDYKNLGNFFSINVGNIKKLIKNNNLWIDDILVKKIWPGTLEIVLKRKKSVGPI